MGSNIFPVPSAGGKTMFRTTLTSGTSYTVPTGATYLNVTLVGGGGGGARGNDGATNVIGMDGHPGQMISSTLSATAGKSIAYAFGAGGTAGSNSQNTSSGVGGTTTFTGATSAVGGKGAIGGNSSQSAEAGTPTIGANNGGKTSAGSGTGGTGGAGCIIVEYWA